jgi:hypothetical protein
MIVLINGVKTPIILQILFQPMASLDTGQIGGFHGEVHSVEMVVVVDKQ